MRSVRPAFFECCSVARASEAENSIAIRQPKRFCSEHFEPETLSRWNLRGTSLRFLKRLQAAAEVPRRTPAECPQVGGQQCNWVNAQCHKKPWMMAPELSWLCHSAWALEEKVEPRRTAWLNYAADNPLEARTPQSLSSMKQPAKSCACVTAIRVNSQGAWAFSAACLLMGPPGLTLVPRLIVPAYLRLRKHFSQLHWIWLGFSYGAQIDDSFHAMCSLETPRQPAMFPPGALKAALSLAPCFS